jgi:hypothetical protein
MGMLWPGLMGRFGEVFGFRSCWTYKQIGELLFISAKTVEHHVAKSAPSWVRRIARNCCEHGGSCSTRNDGCRRSQGYTCAARRDKSESLGALIRSTLNKCRQVRKRFNLPPSAD